MNRITIVLWLLPRRLRSSWVALTITGFGVLIAVTLMALGAIYSQALSEAGLQHALATASPGSLDIRVTIQNRPLGPADYRNLRTAIEQTSHDRIDFLLQDTQRHGRSQPNLALMLTTESEVSPFGGPVGRPFFLTNFESHTRLVEGSWAERAPELHEKGVNLEAVLGVRAAYVMGIELGSTVFLVPFRDDPSERIAIHVVGTVEPLDPKEDYWMGTPGYFRVQSYRDTPLVPFYVTEQHFFDGLGTRYPTLVGDYEWFLFTDTSVLTGATVQPTKESLRGLETDINKRFPRSTVLTLLENSNDTGLLTTYQRNKTLAQVPIFLFISLVVVVILYFLTLVVGLLSRVSSDEASLLRSRGANLFQVGGLLAVGESIAVIVATAAGPFLALLLARYWLLNTINPAGSATPIPVGLSVDMFIWGAVGGVLSLVVLVASSLGLARLGILEFLRARARPPTVPFLQRYYIDVLALLLLGLVFWQTQGRGGFVEGAVSELGLKVEPTLLLGPALAFLAAALLMLRLLPFIMRGLDWAASRFAPSWATFTLARVARDPLPFGSLTVIIMLAAALGVFGSAFQATLSRSQQEQALYDIGGDMVLTGVSFSPATQDQRLGELAAIPGVQSISPLHRERVRTLDGPHSSSTNLLAIDTATLPDAAWFRRDFTTPEKELSELLVPLRRGSSRVSDLSGSRASGIPLPENAESLGIWVNVDELDSGNLVQEIRFSARLLGSRGHYRTIPLGQIATGFNQPQGWSFLEAPLPESVFVQPPLGVISIFITTASFSRMPPGSISLDDLTVKGGSLAQEGLVVEGFEELGRWTPFPHEDAEPDTIDTASSAAYSGAAGLRFAWVEPLGKTPRGILIPPGPFPIPAVGGPGFNPGQVVRVAAGRELVPVTIAATTDFFPTINPSFSPFLLVPLDGYLEYLKRVGRSPEGPEEFWIALEDTADRKLLMQRLTDQISVFVRVQDRDIAVDLARRDPLAGGGWNGLTILSIIVLTLAVVLALGTHAVVSVRSGRIDLTVARALGFSRWQILMSLGLERVVVGLVGLISGGALGYLLARWVLSFLDTTASGRDIIPPVVFTTQVWIMAFTLLCLIAAAALAIALAGLVAGRLRASDILRTTE